MGNGTVDIAELLAGAQECIIYGAGVYGRKIYELLTICGLADKVKCFTITGEAEEGSQVMNLPVIGFAKAESRYPEAVLLLAIKGEEALYQRVKRIHMAKSFFCGKEEIDLLYERVFGKLWENPIKRDKVFFLSNSGKGYLCNGKYITEELIRQRADVDLVWGVRDMTCRMPAQVRKVKVDSPEYYYELATAGIWVDNYRKDIHVHKRKGQYYIQTWHGSGPLKKVEKDVEDALSPEYIRKAKRDGEMIDLFLSGTSANSAMYKNAFYSRGEILECGSPRNDLLVAAQESRRDEIRRKLGLGNQEIKVALYAPTFRKSLEDSVKAYDLDGYKLKKGLESRFGGRFAILVRFHPDLSGEERLKMLYADCIQVTDYEDTQELLAVSDVLITDYSSVFWDFSLQRRPVFLYQNDEQEYLEDRGFYCPPDEWPYPRAHTQEELLREIACFQEEEYIENLESFFRRWPSFDDGHASERAACRIMDVICNPQKYIEE